MSILLAALLLLVGSDAAGLNERALQRLDEGDFDGAVSLLEEAHRASDDEVIVKNLAVARNNRGLDHLNHGRTWKAVSDFEAAIRLRPDEALFRVHLGYAWLKARDHGRAEGVLLEARRRHPEFPKVYDFLGFLYYAKDDLERSIEAYEKRIELEPDDWAARQLERARREFAVSADYVDRSSNDFTLKFLGSGANHAVADAVLALLEDARATVCADLGHYPVDRTMVLLYDDDAFRRATGAHDWVGGLYDGKIRLPLRDFGRQRKQLAATARHEYTHRVIADLAPNCPTWVNEGIAEWFEDGGATSHDAIRRLAAEKADIPSFAEMPASFAEQSDAARVRVQYAASQSFLAFLRDRYGLGALREFVLGLGRGLEVDEAMRRTFGYPLADLEALWRREILR
ncbi:MAG: peptidase MA family metallohydrolase [Planctomycetota bacterium JB042]